jgi:membrane associated rhomboid family serine protease
MQLILVCVFVFFTQVFLQFAVSLSANPAVYQAWIEKNMVLRSHFNTLVTHPWTLLFFPFTSHGFFDLLFNGLAIFWFGHLLTDFLGGKKTFIIFYFGAVFALGFYFVFHILVGLLNHKGLTINNLYGSSTGVYALIFAAVALLPNYEVSFFGFFFKLKYLALAFLLVSFLNPNTGILNLGGAVFGYLHVKFLRTMGWNITMPLERLVEWLSNFTKPRPKTPFKSFSKTKVGDYQRQAYIESTGYFPNQEEVDYLLDKITNNGYDSLTLEEKQRLFKASQNKD